MPPVDRILLRSTRQQRGLKIGQLARLASIKTQHLANIESGHGDPSVEVAHRLAAELGLRPDRLLKKQEVAS
jgi:transcriptional regulator with XRE-family HTH domain